MFAPYRPGVSTETGTLTSQIVSLRGCRPRSTRRRQWALPRVVCAPKPLQWIVHEMRRAGQPPL